MKRNETTIGNSAASAGTATITGHNKSIGGVIAGALSIQRNLNEQRNLIVQRKLKKLRYRSRIFNLVLLFGLIWLLFDSESLTGLAYAEKLFASYAVWGMMVFLTLGILLARQPMKIVALLSLLVLFSSQLSQFDPLTSGAMSMEMVLFSVVMIILSLLAHSVGIGAGLIVEALSRRAFRYS